MALNLTRSLEHHQKATHTIAGGVNSNVRLAIPRYPLCFKFGAGSKLVDVDGNQYIDYMLGLGPAFFGHAPSFINEAVISALELGQSYGGQHPLELEFSNLLRKLVPSAELTRIGCTGSEMVQAAIRVSRAHTGRSKIVKFEGHYHGWLDNILVNQSGSAHDPNGPVPFPKHLQSGGQSALAAAETDVLPWNNVDALSRYLTENRHKIAAILMEPVMCNTGVIAPKPGYLEAVRELCTRHGVVFVMDEVITGFRLGPSGAQGKFDVLPDLTVFAKAIGGGFPLSALVGRKDIMSLIGDGTVNHSGTYNGNVVCVAAGVAVMNRLATESSAIFDGIEKVGVRLIEGIREIASRRRPGLKVTGYPSVFHTFFTDETETTDYFSYRKSNAGLLRTFIASLLEQGVRPSTRGTWFVSAAHTIEDADFTLEAVDRALSLF